MVSSPRQCSGVEYCPGIEGYSSLLVCERNGCPTAPFLSGCGPSFPLFICLLRRRIAVLLGSGLTKLGRLRCLYCLRGTVQSIKY